MSAPTPLPLYYFGPATWFAAVLQSEQVVFNAAERFPRRTNRHRCLVLGPNGPVQLSVYLQHWSAGARMDEIKPSYTESWTKDHWNGIRAGYGRSPYFEHYADYFEPLFSQQFNSLVELNLAGLNACLMALGLSPSYEVITNASAEAIDTSAYPPMKPNIEQLRSAAYPFPEYPQVFADRFPFVPHLSILDLIFNEGPNALQLLR